MLPTVAWTVGIISTRGVAHQDSSHQKLQALHRGRQHLPDRHLVWCSKQSPVHSIQSSDETGVERSYGHVYSFYHVFQLYFHVFFVLFHDLFMIPHSALADQVMENLRHCCRVTTLGGPAEGTGYICEHLCEHQ